MGVIVWNGVTEDIWTTFSKTEALEVVKSQGIKGFMGHDKQNLLLMVIRGF